MGSDYEGDRPAGSAAFYGCAIAVLLLAGVVALAGGVIWLVRSRF